MKSKKIKISIGIMLLLVILLGGFIYIKSQSKFEGNGNGLSGYILGQGVEPDLTPEEIMELLQKQVDESKVVFSVYTEPKFEGKKGKIMFANPRHSAHNIDLTVDLGGKTIIKTGKIEPNQYIEEIELIGRALKKGEHKATGLIRAYNSETDEVVGEVAIDMIITSK